MAMTSRAAVTIDSLDLGLLLGRVGQTGLDREPGGAEERLLDVDPSEQPVTELPDDRQGLPADASAEHEDDDPRMAGQLRRDAQPVGDDRQLVPAAARLEVAGHGQGGRAGIDHDALAVVHEGGRSGPDARLLVRLEALADLERELRPAVVDGDRAAVGPDEATLGLEGHQVLADRDRRDAELRREVGHPGAAVLLDDPRRCVPVARGRRRRRARRWLGRSRLSSRSDLRQRNRAMKVSIGFRRTVDRTRTQCQEGN